MKKNWFSFIMAIIAAGITILMITLGMSFLNRIGDIADAHTARTLQKLTDLYSKIGWGIAIVNLLLGLWAVFKKAGNSMLVVFGLLTIIVGGVVLFLIPGILNIIAGNKGKNKFLKYQIEKEAAQKNEVLQ